MFFFQRYTWRFIELAVQLYPGYIFCFYYGTFRKHYNYYNYSRLTFSFASNLVPRALLLGFGGGAGKGPGIGRSHDHQAPRAELLKAWLALTIG